MRPDTAGARRPSRGGQRRLRGSGFALAVAVFATAAAPAFADLREPVGGPAPINSPANRSAETASLASVAGVPHVAYVSDTTQQGQGNSSAIRVARYTSDGTAWAGLAEGSPDHPPC